MSCTGTLPVTGSWAGEVEPPDFEGYDNIVFVAIADNVSTDGSLQLPYHTIGEGLAEAASRTPTATDPVCVHVFGGSYSESALSMTAHVHLQGANRDSVLLRHASNMLTVAVDNSSVSGFTFEATSTNSIVSVDGTSMTDYARFYNCHFVGAGSNNNVVKGENGGLAKFFDCTVEAQNVGDRIIETDSDADNDFKFYKTEVLGDVLHAGGDLEFNDVTSNMGVSCTGSSSLTVTDTFWRNSIDHCLELGTTGDVFLYRNTLLSPGYVDPNTYYCVSATVDPGTNEWIDNTFRHDGVTPDYTVSSTVAFTFSGDRNDMEEGYNSNCTDDGLASKATPVDADTVIIEDSADSWKRKKVALGDIGIGGGASALSSLTIDTNKDWLGYDLTNVGVLEVDEQLTVPRDQAGVTGGDVRYNTSDVALEYYDGAAWHDAGSPALVSAAESTVAEGNNSLTSLKDKYLVKSIEITTSSTDWTMVVYSKDDYASDPITVLKGRSGSLVYYWDYPYEDKDSTSEFHYNFTDDSGANTHNIELLGSSLR